MQDAADVLPSQPPCQKTIPSKPEAAAERKGPNVVMTPKAEQAPQVVSGGRTTPRS